ncbi:MAG: hypothetical protein NTW12_07550 [Deltaproteobacteria bacterium]|nr:hypothetical protein [Deltaproteobacteria bacterium]
MLPFWPGEFIVVPGIVWIDVRIITGIVGIDIFAAQIDPQEAL